MIYLNPAFFQDLAQQSPHELTHVRASLGHHLATVRRAGRKRGARFESTEALAELRAAGSGAQCRGVASMLRQGVARCGARPTTY